MLEKLKKAADRVFNVKLVNGKPIPVSVETPLTDYQGHGEDPSADPR